MNYIIMVQNILIDCQYKLVRVWPLQVQQQFLLQVSGHFSVDTLISHGEVQVVRFPEL